MQLGHTPLNVMPAIYREICLRALLGKFLEDEQGILRRWSVPLKDGAVPEDHPEIDEFLARTPLGESLALIAQTAVGETDPSLPEVWAEIEDAMSFAMREFGQCQDDEVEGSAFCVPEAFWSTELGEIFLATRNRLSFYCEI